MIVPMNYNLALVKAESGGLDYVEEFLRRTIYSGCGDISEVMFTALQNVLDRFWAPGGGGVPGDPSWGFAEV